MTAPVLSEHDGILVVRDDLYPGGTKARVLPEVLQAIAADAFVYASPVQGHAQIALALACAALGRRAHIVCAKWRHRHERTQIAAEAGAHIHEVGAPAYFSVCRSRAAKLAAETGAHLLPPGLDTPDMREALAGVARSLPITPREVWSIAGTGTLTRALQIAWPDASFEAVRVGMPPDAGCARIWGAPEEFRQPARHPPPFPSCDNYDAKAWQFVREHAAPGALFWNVA